MGVLHGTNAKVTLDNAAGSAIDVTAYVDDIGPELSQAMHDITTLGATATVETPGLKSGKCSISFLNDAAYVMFTQLTAIYANQTPGSTSTYTLTFDPNGTGSTKPRLVAELLLMTLPIPAKVNDVEKIATAWTVTGGWTPSIQS